MRESNCDETMLLHYGEKLFTSGMAAISSAIMHFVKPNGHIITLKNIYGPANNFIGRI